ncbi:MAG: sulfur transferase domain-containing protein [Hyphomicrobiaceae bacterium]
MTTLLKKSRRAMRKVTSGLRRGIVLNAPDWMRRHLGRPASHFELYFIDHGIFRSLYLNRHRLSREAWRSAQPAPRHIARFARLGVRTIVNLRGERDCSSYWLEREACERHGIRLVNYQVRSRAAPSVQEIRGAAKLFDEIEYPVLMHCKSGADRAGLMSALFCYMREGEPIELARQQLSLKFGHIKQADTGILDYFFERYLADNALNPMPFMEWVETVYDPVELKQSFQSSSWANRLVNTVLQRE